MEPKQYNQHQHTQITNRPRSDLRGQNGSIYIIFKQSGTSATLQTTFNQTVADAQAAQQAAEDASDLALQYKTAAENARDTANTHAGNAQTSAGGASTAVTNAGNHEADALKIASTAHNTQYTLE